VGSQDAAVQDAASGQPAPDRGSADARQLLTLGAALLCSSLSLNLFNGSLPVYLSRQGFSLEAIGFLVGLSFVPQLVATPLVGPLVDRRGGRLAIRVGSGLMLLAAVLLPLSSGGLAVGTARLLQGLGFALVMPASYALVPTVVSERRRGAALGSFGAFPNVALAAAPPLGLWLLQLTPAALFLASAAAGAAGCLASLALAGGRRVPARKRFFTYRRRWTPLLAVAFLTVLYFGVVLACLPLQVPGSQLQAVGWYFSADALAVLVFRVPAGFLTDRYGPRWLLLAGIGVTLAGILLLVLPPSPAQLVAAGVTTGLGAALVLPPVLVELGRRSDEGNRGTAMALYTTSFAASIGAGSMAGALLVDRLGFGPTLWLTALACLLAVPLVLAGVGRRGRAGTA
jgi:MFS family permease